MKSFYCPISRKQGLDIVNMTFVNVSAVYFYPQTPQYCTMVSSRLSF